MKVSKLENDRDLVGAAGCHLPLARYNPALLSD